MSKHLQPGGVKSWAADGGPGPHIVLNPARAGTMKVDASNQPPVICLHCRNA